MQEVIDWLGHNSQNGRGSAIAKNIGVCSPEGNAGKY